MRYLQNYQQHNEGLKSTLTGIGLAVTSLQLEYSSIVVFH